MTTPRASGGIWQTRRIQVPVSARTWGFNSPLAHDPEPRKRADRCAGRHGSYGALGEADAQRSDPVERA